MSLVPRTVLPVSAWARDEASPRETCLWLPIEIGSASFHNLSVDCLEFVSRPEMLPRRLSCFRTYRRSRHCIATIPSLKNLRVLSRKRSEEHTSELQSRSDIVCRLLLEKKTAYYL